jgi:protein disulfide-isomerase A1
MCRALRSASRPSSFAVTLIIIVVRLYVFGCHRQKQPAWISVKSQKEIDDFVADDGDIEVVAFIAESDKASLDAFVAVAKNLRNDYEFAVATDASLVPAGKSQPAVVLYRKFDEPQVVHSGEWTEEAISGFVRGNAFPLVGEIGPENYQKYLERGFPLVWIFIDKTKDQVIISALTSIDVLCSVFCALVSAT